MKRILMIIVTLLFCGAFTLSNACAAGSSGWHEFARLQVNADGNAIIHLANNHDNTA